MIRNPPLVWPQTMKLAEQYKNNRPLLNSVLTGLFYFIFCWSLDFADGIGVLFMKLMLFLPGLTFPLTSAIIKQQTLLTQKYKE